MCRESELFASMSEPTGIAIVATAASLALWRVLLPATVITHVGNHRP